MLPYVVFVIVGGFFLVNADYFGRGTRSIQFNIAKSQFHSTSFDITPTDLLVKRNMSVNIILKNYHAVHTTCKNKVHDYNFNRITLTASQHAGVWTSTIEIPEITEDMNTKWGCTMTRSDEKQQEITFKMHVKGMKGVSVAIGVKKIKYDITDTSVVHFDGHATYNYEDGETINVVCRNPGNEDRIRLRYYNRIGTKLVESNTISTKDHGLEFRKTLNIDNNDDFIDCILITRTPISSSDDLFYEYTYRTTLKITGALSNIYSITVNGLKLAPKPIATNKENYQYKFVAGEILTVTCEKYDDILGDLRFESDMKPIQEDTEDPSRITIKLDTGNLNKKHVKCINKGPLEKTADILFTLDENEPFILGLPTSDIIQQYSCDSSTWIIDYAYSLNQILNLTCGTRAKSTLRWLFMNNSIVSPVPTRKTKSISNSFTFKEDDNGTSFTCAKIINPSDARKTVVNLHLKSNSRRPDYPQQKDTNLDQYIVIGSVVVAAVTIFLTTTCLVLWCRMKMNRSDNRNVYENLTHEPDTPIPEYPSQWENGQAISPNIPDHMINNPLYFENRASICAMPQKNAINEYEYVETPVPKLDLFLKQEFSRRNNTGQGSPNPPYSNVEDHSKLSASKSKENDYNEYAEPVYCEVVLPK